MHTGHLLYAIEKGRRFKHKNVSILKIHVRKSIEKRKEKKYVHLPL